MEWFAVLDTSDFYSAHTSNWSSAMVSYMVTMGRPGGGSGTIEVRVAALTPDMARNIASAQYPHLSVHAVKAAR